MNPQILVVEDEPDIAALVAYHLARVPYHVRTASDGSEALRVIEAEPPDLILLDLMLPGTSGMEILSAIRAREEIAHLPVILLTARKEESDRIEGFRAGADDYLAKPFSPQELVLRVAAVLRRTQQGPPPARIGKTLRVGPFKLNRVSAQASAEGEPLDLTHTEFRLLEFLLERRGRVQSREQLLEHVWDVSMRISTRTVDMHVQRLRAKLGRNSDWLETVRGFGYRLRSDK